MKKFTLLLLWALCGWSLLAQNQTFFVDFGPNDVTNGNSTVNPDANGFYWNNVTNPSAAGGPVSLVDTLNQVTSAYVQVTTTFSSNGINHGGLLASDPTLLGNLAVNTATQDYFFTTGTSSIEIGGLDAGAGYVFDLFGTRQTTITRETQYTLTGTASDVGVLQTSGAGIGDAGYDGNNNTFYTSGIVYADGSGVITLDVSVSAGGFAYLGMMRVVREVAAPAPAPNLISRSFWLDLGPDDGTNGNATSNPDANGNYWNNLTNPSTSSSPVTLIESDNTASTVQARIASDFSSNGILNGGLLSPSAALLDEFAIGSATEDYFFTTAKGTLILDGLDTDKAYILNLFGTRNTPQTRLTRYTISGSNAVVDSLQTSGTDLGGAGDNGNNSTVLASGRVRPDDQGRIQIDVEVSEGGFAYLGALRVDEVNVEHDYYVDFGPNDGTNGNETSSPDANGHYWNNLIDPSVGGDTLYLVNANNQSEGHYLKTRSTFLTNGINHGGLLSPSAGLLDDFAIATATQDYFFLSSATGTLEVGGLDTTKGYIFHFFGTRNTTITRSTTYDLAGQNTYSGDLQTSGTDLGGSGYHGNNSTILVSDTLYPDTDGQIDLTVSVASGGFAYLGAMKVEEVIPLRPRVSNCVAQDPLRISIMGSSVAFGTGATSNQGYAYQVEQMLDARFAGGLGADWNVSNISIPGNSTVSLLNRFETDLVDDCGSFVVYGLSLGNEGIISQGQAAFDQFRDNLLILIDEARAEGIEPIIVNCYPRNDYTATEYDFTKDMNLLIHGWDVASVNALGAIDDGSGNMAAGYSFDVSHPNDNGHLEFSYAFVPSMFDALQSGKTQPSALLTNTLLTVDKSSTDYQLEFTPEGTLHSFTYAFDVRTSGLGPIASFTTDGGDYASLLIDPATGELDYQPNGVTAIAGGTVVNDGTWHQVVVTHFYAQGQTLFYVDNVLQGTHAETLNPDKFILSESNAPTADYRNWFVYRSGFNVDEVNALAGGSLLKSSMELYAPLDQNAVTGPDPLVNLAMSTNDLSQEPASEITGTFPVEWISFEATPQGRSVQLDWVVANEVNNAGFGVEIRSEDENDFEQIAFVPGLGDQAELREYRYRIDELNPGTYEFRLRQVDLDGAQGYSQVLTAVIDGLGSSYQVFPQPAGESVTIRVQASARGNLDLELLDLSGRRVQTWTIGLTATGQQDLLLDLEQVPAGVYTLRISDGTSLEILRLNKQ